MKRRSGRRWTCRRTVACALLVAGCSQSAPPRQPGIDTAAIAAADLEYATAWLANDPVRIMASLTADAVLVPSGLPVLDGADAISAFWWPPDSPATRVTRFQVDQSDVNGSGELGYVRGSFTLEFEYDGASYARTGDYLSLLKQQPDGSWRIFRRMWNDHPTED